MADSQEDKFSLAVAGSGMLEGMFTTEAMKRFPKGTFFDQTEQFHRAVRDEIKLGTSPYASPAFHKSALRALQNLEHPGKVDVTVTFRDWPDGRQSVIVKGPQGVRFLQHRFHEHSTMHDAERFVRAMLHEVSAVLRHANKHPKLANS